MLHPADILHTAETTYIKNNKTLPAPHHQSARRGMCHHTRADPKYVSAYCYMCVLILLYVCPQRSVSAYYSYTFVCIKYARPHAIPYVRIHSYASRMRVRMLYRTSAYYCIYSAYVCIRYVSSHCYICYIWYIGRGARRQGRSLRDCARGVRMLLYLYSVYLLY